ncbi:methyltransferase type 11 [Paractinoplanes deccanensis]|uniref:Methyltransferase type 11 n=1 Tax=Paractinoplanes deccanensis TaxID=113561 RepID=A0ABQ3Y3J7_9ACTN|nr:class I SAM-dependent methyltransferase [Actinoplanes deccanensis]GID74573.1 methyltransferase type 11 [Actinoplanes deccanensis]
MNEAARVFGSAAEQYEAGRPGYHEGLAAEVLRYAGPATRTAVEVGAGTGKATVQFAAAGLSMVCLEPDARMAEVLRHTVAAYPSVSVVVSDFESWPARRADLLLAGTSWHWVDPRRCWDLAANVVAPGGTVALFWNPLGIVSPRLQAALAEIELAHGIDESVITPPASSYGTEPGDWDISGMWPAAALEASGRFGDVRQVRFRDEITYSTAGYLALLDSTSAYRLLVSREAALADVAHLLGSDGLRLTRITDVCLARRLQ